LLKLKKNAEISGKNNGNKSTFFKPNYILILDKLSLEYVK